MNITEELRKEIRYFYYDTIESRMKLLNISEDEAIESIIIDLDIDYLVDELEKD